MNNAYAAQQNNAAHHVRTENSPMAKNAKQLRSKQLLNSEERIKPIASNVGHHGKVLTATFNKDFIDKVQKENNTNKMQDIMVSR